MVKKKSKKVSKQAKQQNKILRNIFLVFLSITLIIGSYFLSSYYITNFEYNGLEFKIIKEGDIIFYHTFLNLERDDAPVKYNFYLRNDPRKLEKITFEEDLLLLTNMVLNVTDEFNCNGDGVIAIANLANLYSAVGINIIRDENATCDEQGRYKYLNIQPGEETKIEHDGSGCYQMYISDCEILKGTERFMLDSLVELNKMS